MSIGNSVTYIGVQAFDNCSSLTEVTIPSLVTYIDDTAFRGCKSLSSVYIPDSVTYISAYAFMSCDSLTMVVIPCSTGKWAFFGCENLNEVTIGESVRTIGEYAFANCNNLKTLNFNSNNCTYFGSFYQPVFHNCTKISTLNIGENVTNIPQYAFKDCVGLTSVTSYAISPIIAQNNIFDYEVYSSAILYVPEESINAYQTTEPWLNFNSIVGVDFSSVDVIETVSDAVEVARYDINGRLLDKPVKVLNIIKMSDGTIRKEIVSTNH